MSSHNMLDFQDGLPKQFVASLKILFDILDEEHTGLIHLRDIESRWSDEGVKDLPSGVMEGLRKVVPPSGFLTFDIFVSGLKLALFQTGQDQLKRRSVSGSALTQKENRSPAGTVPFSGSSRLAHSSPNPPLQSSPGNRQVGSSPTDNNKATGKPSPRSAIPQLQQKSPQHDSRPATAAVKPQPSSTNSRHAPSYPPPPSSSVDHPHPNYPIPSRLGPPPPRPERSLNPQIRKPAPDVNPPQVPPRDQRQNQKITSDLSNWQRDRIGANSGMNKTGMSIVHRDRPHPSDDAHHAIYGNFFVLLFCIILVFHTHFVSPSRFLTLFVCLSVCVSLSVSFCHSLSVSVSVSLSVSFSLSLSLSLFQ